MPQVLKVKKKSKPAKKAMKAGVSKAARKTGKVAKKAAGALLKGAAAGAAAKRKTSSTKKPSGPKRSSIGSSIGKDGYRPRRDQRSRPPYQETDTGPGLMTATGSKTRKKKPSVRRKK